MKLSSLLRSVRAQSIARRIIHTGNCEVRRRSAETGRKAREFSPRRVNIARRARGGEQGSRINSGNPPGMTNLVALEKKRRSSRVFFASRITGDVTFEKKASGIKRGTAQIETLRRIDLPASYVFFPRPGRRVAALAITMPPGGPAIRWPVIGGACAPSDIRFLPLHSNARPFRRPLPRARPAAPSTRTAARRSGPSRCGSGRAGGRLVRPISSGCPLLGGTLPWFTRARSSRRWRDSPPDALTVRSESSPVFNRVPNRVIRRSDGEFAGVADGGDHSVCRRFFLFISGSVKIK